MNGDKHLVRVSDCETATEAVNQAIATATKAGWTPPRPWQWWRMSDTRLQNENPLAVSDPAQAESASQGMPTAASRFWLKIVFAAAMAILFVRWLQVFSGSFSR